MITKDKVIEIFCVIDEFDKNLNAELAKNLCLPARGHGRKTAQKPQGADVGKRDNGGAGMLPFRLLPHVQGLLPVLRQVHGEGLLPRCGLLQPLRGADAEGLCQADALHEDVRLRTVHRDHVRRQHDDTGVPQCQETFQQGVRGHCQGRQGHDGMVPRLQAAPALHGACSQGTSTGRCSPTGAT